ncbi:MAG: hypothetical protein ACI4PH_10370, partial [Faecousia sp.]
LRMASVSTCGCMILVLAAKIVYLLLYGGNLGGELMSIGIALVAAAGAAAPFVLERKAVYTTIPNDTVLPEGEAHEIW